MFAVILTRSGGRPPSEIADSDGLISALAPFARPDSAGKWSNAKALLVQALHHNTPASLNEHTPEICAETGRIIVSWVRLDNRPDLCSALELNDTAQLSDPQVILAAHRKWGRECARKLEGDFSFVIHDPASRESYCARDAIGAKPLFYLQTDEHFIAASSVAAIKAIGGLGLTPSLNWIALFASGFAFANDETAYSEVSKLLPGHDLAITPNGHESPQKYFEFDLNAPHRTARDPAQVELYREVFHSSVDARARSSFLIGAENSGGLDSASILARLVDVVPFDHRALPTFSLVAHQREIDLLKELSEMLGQTLDHTLIRPEILRMDASVERAIIAIGHPPEHGQPLLSAPFFERGATLGMRTVLSGFGGDEIATGYAKHLIDELHARRAWRAVFDEIEGSPLRRMARFVRRLMTGPDGPESMQQGQIDAKLAASCLSEEFLEDSGLRQRIEGWMLPDYGGRTVSEIAALSPSFRHARTGRLESSALFAATYGIEYRFPLYDRKLVQFFLNVPAIEKRRRSIGRYLHRRAVAGSIPDAIAWQPTKDMGPPLEGEFHVALQPRMAFDELAWQLQTVFDGDAFNATQELIANHNDSLDHTVMRAKYFMWHVQQLNCWLKG